MNKIEDQMIDLGSLIQSLSEINEDITVPRNVRNQIQNIINTLKEDVILSIKVNKVLNQLDELANDVNLQPYTRTQIWNVMSALEKMC